MKLRKIVLSVISLCLCAALFTGCGGTKKISMSAGELSDKLAAEVLFQDQMSKVEDRTFYALYEIDKNIVSEAAVYMSTGATAEEIAVVKVKDAKDTKAVEEAFAARVEAQKSGFENYVPGELTKLSSPVIRTVGDTVVLCISDHNDKAGQIIDSATK